ncbi:hypothetical protein ACQR1W_12730 [Bradyrhizobium sp. HKCCYLS1011]|uniref:hypothetical protein n=1 Tax=Bradyrhizobium sp. HKCCYLS1011 TaxID=3420733 RepID=UPI003EBD9BD3
MLAAPEVFEKADDLDVAAAEAIAACGGNTVDAVKALILANRFLEMQLEEMRTEVSAGYSRGRHKLPRDRDDGFG